jgi:hypothetical protein
MILGGKNNLRNLNTAVLCILNAIMKAPLVSMALTRAESCVKARFLPSVLLHFRQRVANNTTQVLRNYMPDIS